MAILKKIILLALGALTLTVIIAISFALWFSPSKTPAISGANVGTQPIAEQQRLAINGSEQYLLLRGANRDNPVLLLVHGGPGSPDTPFYRHHNAVLEQHFTIAFWHQRGAGKSQRSGLSPEDFTVEQFVADAHAVTAHLKQSLGKDKIFILGHSWGSMLALSTVAAHPDDYHAYIGTGQLANVPASEALAFQAALEHAKSSDDDAALAQLQKVGAFSGVPIDADFLAARAQVSRFGLSYEKGPFDLFIKPLILTQEYSLTDKIDFVREAQSLESIMSSPAFNLLPVIFNTDLSTEIPAVDVPVFMLQGRHDFLAHHDVAKDYFDRLNTTQKQFFSFEKSAHFPAFEEPQKFNQILVEHIRPIAN